MANADVLLLLRDADKTKTPNWERGEAPGDRHLSAGESYGRHTSRALLGFHYFTGADWGGKFVGLSKKTWITAFLSLDDNEGNGWSEKGLPFKCLVPSAPRAVVELVKCGCKGECKGNCYRANNGLACAPLCKCYAAGCSNHKEYHRDDQD